MSTSTETNPTFTFPDIGSYDVALTVSLPNGQEATVTRRILIFELITAAFTFEVGDCGNDVTFTDTSTTTETITEWHWDFGDGEESTDQNPTHRYLTIDDFSVTLQIQTVATGIGVVSHTVSIEEIVPDNVIADFTFVVDDLDVDFTDTSTADTSVVAWYWDFGDGDNSTDQNPSHTYSVAGTYTVTLVATGECGEEDDFSDDATAEEPPPPAILGKGASNAAVITTAAKVVTTSDFQSGLPTWTSNDLSGATIDQIYAAKIDPFSPAYLETGDEINAYAIGTTSGDLKAYYIADLFGARTASDLHTFADAIAIVTLEVSRFTQGHIAVVGYEVVDNPPGFSDTNETFLYTSTDGGSGWDTEQVTFAALWHFPTPSDHITNSGQATGGVDINSDGDATIYWRRSTTDVITSWHTTLESGSLGGSFSDVGFYGVNAYNGTDAGVIGGAAGVYTPYGNTATFTFAPHANGLYKDNSDVTPLDSVDGADLGMLSSITHPLASYKLDDDMMYGVFRYHDTSPASTDVIELHYSTDGGSTWTFAGARHYVVDNPTYLWNSVWFADDDPSTVFIVGSHTVMYTEDFTSMPDEKANGTLSTATIVAIATS